MPRIYRKICISRIPRISREMLPDSAPPAPPAPPALQREIFPHQPE